jgi:hypothetical protein
LALLPLKEQSGNKELDFHGSNMVMPTLDFSTYEQMEEEGKITS